MTFKLVLQNINIISGEVVGEGKPSIRFLSKM